MRKHWVRLLAIWIAVGFSCTGAEYGFSIPEADVTVQIQRDGTARIHYRLAFFCLEGAHTIDVVDIGMPNQADHRPEAARINGHFLPTGNTRVSTVLEPRGAGYEIRLGEHEIRPGESGTFEFEAIEESMVWQDTTDPNQASFRFTPTWFGSAYVHGRTKLVIRVKLPIPVAEYDSVADRIVWQKKGEMFSAKGVMEGENCVSVAWARTVSLTGPNMIGVSFPRQYVKRLRQDSVWLVFRRWFERNERLRIVVGIALVAVFSVAFFVLTRMTGWTLWVIVTAFMTAGMVKSTTIQLALFPLVCVFAVLVPYARHRKRRNYFPAELCIEGEGLCRGLTAVEAAILLELQFSKVLTMIIFGLVKKGVVRVETAKPLRLTPYGGPVNRCVWELPDGKRVNLWPYEEDTLDTLSAGAFSKVEDIDFQRPFDRLIRGVVRKMRGHSLDLSRDYYRFLVARAWDRVQKESDIQARFVQADRDLSWLMMDDGWWARLDSIAGGYRYRPWWWYGGSRHSYAVRVRDGGATTSSPRVETSFGDVVNSIAGRAENACSNLASRLDCLSAAGKGGVDLSGIDHFTGDMLRSLAESSGDSSGGGFGGCACAGCACACACAGGGR